MSVDPTASGAIPRGWDVDHDVPTHFVVRCSHCDRISIEHDRGEAHTRADNHALHCHPTGVTPVRKPEDAEDVDDFSSGKPTTGGLDAFGADVTGEEIVVNYESVSDRAGEQRITGDIVAMVPASEEEPVDHRGIIVRLDNQRRRRVDLLREAVDCPHNCEDGWRTIGHLRSIAPAPRADNPPVMMTDGGQEVETVEDDTDLAGYRAVCESCEWRSGLFREAETIARGDRNIHNEKKHEGAPVAAVEEFPARLNAAGHLLEVNDGE